jgi:hypothetical protein
LKLVVARGGSGSAELYDLSKDIGEMNNLASAQPDKVRELQALWDAWNTEQAPSSSPQERPRPRARARAKRET